jgi:hypothetical protein
MFDPAAMGTLLIGLNADRAETHANRRHRPIAVRPSHRASLRVALASGLRRAAALLDQPRVGEVSQ